MTSPFELLEAEVEAGAVSVSTLVSAMGEQMWELAEALSDVTVLDDEEFADVIGLIRSAASFLQTHSLMHLGETPKTLDKESLARDCR